jgi:beta-N-acetylhexosaminidase
MIRGVDAHSAQAPAPGRARQRALVGATAALLLTAAGCGTQLPVRNAGSTGTATSPTTPTLPPSTPVPSPAPTPTACTSAGAVAAWPLSRRAAQLVVIPVLNGDLVALAPSLRRGAGGILLYGTAPADLRQQIQTAEAAAAVRATVMADQEGGGVQRLGSLVDSLPWPRQMAQSMSVAAVTAAAQRVGTEMKALGVEMDLAPVADIDGGDGPSNSNPDGMRSFSPDPSVAAAYADAFAAGLRAAGVVAVAKHFPGLGGATANTDTAPASTPPLSQLQSGGLVPFRSAVARGIPAVMVANAAVPGLTSLPASISPDAVNGLLRGRLGFHGLVLTDSLSARAISAAGYTITAAAVAAVKAGADMVLFGSTLTPQDTQRLAPGYVDQTLQSIVNALIAAVRSGSVPESRVDDAVLHVLAAKGINPCSLPG